MSLLWGKRSLIRKAGHFGAWAVGCRLLGQRRPLTSSLIISDKCTLRCKHCTVTDLGYPDLTLADLRRDVDTLHELGSRVLIITGGEPFLWRHGRHGLDDVVAHAHRRGFFRVVVCTNGTLPLSSSADYLWVSLDGSPRVHDGVRGEGFERVWRNIQQSAHPRIYVNYTASRLNAHGLEQAFEQMAASPAIRGVMFHLFTPVLGSDQGLALEGEQRRAVVRRLLRLKRRHPLRVTNTYDGLRALRDDAWQRPVWSAVVINQGQLTSCCCRDGLFDAQTCALCGCTPAMETWVLQQLRPLALLENLRFL
jgi:MoaA/NifB/PqqE/SkfB family radical SAM enzyme